jgi:hypothetical protein
MASGQRRREPTLEEMTCENPERMWLLPKSFSDWPLILTMMPCLPAGPSPPNLSRKRRRLAPRNVLVPRNGDHRTEPLFA